MMKSYTPQKDTHEGERTFQDNFFFPLRISLYSVGCDTHSHKAHTLADWFVQKPQEQGRLQANYSLPEKPDLCNSVVSSTSTKPSQQASGITLPAGRSPVSTMAVKRPQSKEQGFEWLCRGTPLILALRRQRWVELT